MRTARDYLDEYRRRQRWAEDSEELLRAIDEAMADARADERVKATAEAYEKVGRTFAPRGGGAS